MDYRNLLVFGANPEKRIRNQGLGAGGRSLILLVVENGIRHRIARSSDQEYSQTPKGLVAIAALVCLDMICLPRA